MKYFSRKLIIRKIIPIVFVKKFLDQKSSQDHLMETNKNNLKKIIVNGNKRIVQMGISRL